MSGRGGDDLQQLYFASRHGASINDNGGYYQRGKTYGLEVKLFVAAKYLDHKERRGGLRPVLKKVAVECRVERHFVAKIERELMENERVLAPDEKHLAGATGSLVGPGSRSMSDEDFFVLYMLYRQEPTRSLKSYRYWLFCCTGTIVSESTVSRWFNHAFPIKGRLCVPNLIPYDKFNFTRRVECLHCTSIRDHNIIIFICMI